MRLFIAIDLPKEIKDYLYELQKEIISKINTREIKIKWVHKKNIHCTLKFIKYFPEDKLDYLKKLVSEIKFEPFKAVLDGTGLFPSENYIRVVWVGLKAPEIFEIQQEIDEKLSDLFKKEKEFTTHLTLGRVKYMKDKEDLLKVIKSLKIESKEFIIDKIKIFESKLTMDGPIYTEIKV